MHQVWNNILYAPRPAERSRKKSGECPAGPRRAAEEPYQSLFSNSKARNNGPVSGNVFVLQIIEQASPLPDHH